MELLYMTTDEVSKMLRISISKIYKMTMNNEIPHYKVGGKLLFKKQEVIDFVEGKEPSVRTECPDRFDLISPFQMAA